MINRKRKEEIHDHPDRLVRNGKVFTTRYDIANQFNSHFINVGPSLANLIPDYNNSDPTVYIHNSPMSSFVMSTVTESQVSKLFSDLNIHKVSHEIPNRLIKIASEQLSVPFTFIYNKSVTSGVVPDVFKTSRVTPIYKNGNITDPNNYRPIFPYCLHLVKSWKKLFTIKCSCFWRNIKSYFLISLGSEKVIRLNKQFLK